MATNKRAQTPKCRYLRLAVQREPQLPTPSPSAQSRGPPSLSRIGCCWVVSLVRPIQETPVVMITNSLHRSLRHDVPAQFILRIAAHRLRRAPRLQVHPLRNSSPRTGKVRVFRIVGEALHNSCHSIKLGRQRDCDEPCPFSRVCEALLEEIPQFSS